MAYIELKEELAKILNEDFNNRQSLQEVRRNIFLNSENTKKQQEMLAEKEAQLLALRSSVSKIEEETAGKISELEQLQSKIQQQEQDFEHRENDLLDLISELKAQTSSLTAENKSLLAFKDEANSHSIENAAYAEKIRNLIFRIDEQNEINEKLEKEIESLKNKLKNNAEEHAQLSLHLSDTSSKDETITLLTEELELAKEKMSLLATQLTTANELIHSQNNSITEFRTREVKLTNDLITGFKEYIHENELLIKDNAELISDIELIKSENEDLKQSNNSLLNQAEEFTKLISELREKDTVIANLTEEKELLLKSSEEKEKTSFQYEELQKTIEILGTEVHTLNHQISELTVSHALELEEQYYKKEDLNLIITSLQAQLQEVEDWQSKKNSLEQTITSLQTQLQEVETLQAEKHSLEQTIDSLQTQLQKVETLQAEKHSLEQSIASLQTQLQKVETLQAEKNSLEQTIDSLQTQLKEQELNQSNSESANDEAFIDKLFKQIDLLNDEKLRIESEYDEVKDTLGTFQEKYRELAQVIENQQNEIISLEERNKQIKLANTLTVSGKDKTGLKLKINELVREIDKCIALLSV